MTYTPDSLLEIAAEASKAYVSDKDSETNYYGFINAVICARWMKDSGIKEIANVGPFTTHDINIGDKVRVRKGAKLQGRKPYSEYAKKTYIVTVHDIYDGYVIISDPLYVKDRVVNPRIAWSGKNGVVVADINDVEKV